MDTLCLENGKLRYEAGFEAHFIIRALRFAAGLALHTFGRVLDPRPGVQSMSIRQPVGVAGIITPWNSPAYLSIRSLAPAMAAGCTAVVKMPQQAAHTAQLMGEVIASVSEIPPGVVNIFTETGSEGARLLVDSPLVPTISFTGSTATGRQIAQAAAVHLKRVGLELGGKTPHLVFDDADLNAVLPTLEKSSTVFAGQFCMTGSRILAQRGIADQLKAGLAQRLEKVRPGPAAEPSSDMGPMIDKAAVARVDAMVEEAIRAGAKPVLRGGPSTAPALAGGAFYHPTLLEVTDPVAADRAEGDLRPGADGAGVRRRGSGGSPGQRQRIWPQRLHLEPRHRPADAGGAPPRGRPDLHQQLGEPGGGVRGRRLESKRRRQARRPRFAR